MPEKSEREARESPVEQGVDEKRAYTFDFTGLGTSTPSNPAVTVYDITDPATRVDVTETVMPTNSPGASGAIVTTSLLVALTAGHVYRIECRADGPGGSRYEGYCLVYARQ